MPRIISNVNYSIVLIFCASFTLGEIKITNGPKNTRAKAGKTVKFPCAAKETSSTQYGKPGIEWSVKLRNVGRIEMITHQHSRYKITKHSNILVIKNLTVADTGNYTCAARLDPFYISKSVELIVEDVPDPPTDVELTQCSGRIAQVQWKLINENYSPVKYFIIEYNTSFAPNIWKVGKSGVPGTSRSQRIAVSPWGNYTFRVIAVNKVNKSEPSIHTLKVCSTPPDVPRHSPSEVCTLNYKPHTLVITWKPMPMEEHNGPGFYYLVKWKQQESPEVTNPATSERVVDADVHKIIVERQPVYTAYIIYVLAVNQMGPAVLSRPYTIGYSSEREPTEKVKKFRLNSARPVTNTTADFIWNHVDTAPASWNKINGFFRGYKIEFWKTKEGMSTKRDYTLILEEPVPCWKEGGPLFTRQKRFTNEYDGHLYNLWPYTNITAHVRVLNAKYEGPPSSTVTFRTKEGVPGPVSQFSIIKKDSSKFELQWKKPALPHGILTGYIISYRTTFPEYHPMKKFSINDPELTHAILTNLIPDSKYQVFVAAKTSVGVGQSVQHSESTLPAGPPVAPNFTWENVSNLKGAIKVSWFQSGPGNPGSNFLVKYKRYGQDKWTEQEPENPQDNFCIIKGLQPMVAYEMFIVAKNGNTDDSPKTNSVVKKVRIGMKRDLEQPTFRLDFSDWNDKKVVYVFLTHYDKPAVTSFYVQYKPNYNNGLTTESGWITLSDTLVSSGAVIGDLEEGMSYHIRVVTKSPFEEAISLETEFVPGKGETSPSSSANLQSITSGSRDGNCVYRLKILSITIIVLQILRGYL